MPFIDMVNAGTTGNANIDTNYNIYANPPMTGSKSGFVSIESQIDPGNVIATGTGTFRNIGASQAGRLRMGVDVPLFFDKFSVPASQNTSLYFYSGNGFAVNQTGNFLILNSTGSTVNGNGGYYKTWRSFPVQEFGTYFDCWAQLAQTGLAGNVTEWGLALSTGNTLPLDGVFFRSSGTLQAVVNTSGTETIVSGIPWSLVGTGITNHYNIDIQGGVANFFINGQLVANPILQMASGIPAAYTGNASSFNTSSTQLPIAFRSYNFTTVSSPQQLYVSSVSVTDEDTWNSRPWADTIAGMGGNASQGQNGSYITGTTAVYSNSTTPSAATGLNTGIISSGSAYGLGGLFNLYVPVSGATDLIIASFQVPSGTSQTPGKTLYVHGVSLGGLSIGSTGQAAVPVTAVVTASYGSTSTSLATSETSSFTSSTTKAPRIVPIGTISWPTGTAVGAPSQNGDLIMPFTSPLVVNTTEYFSVTAKFVNASGNTGQSLALWVDVNGYME